MSKLIEKTESDISQLKPGLAVLVPHGDLEDEGWGPKTFVLTLLERSKWKLNAEIDSATGNIIVTLRDTEAGP